MKTVGIDASSANKPHKTGVEWYAYHLIQNMKKHALRPDERVLLYSPAELRGGLAEWPAGWSARQLSWTLKRGWMQIRMSAEMIRHKPDLLFVPAQGLPRVLGKKTATTIHDLGFLHRPDLYEVGTRKILELATQEAVNRSDQIITVSETTRQDILNQYPLSPDKVSVTPLAVDFSVFKTRSAQEIQLVREELGIKQPYFLYVGRLEAKKNLPTLIKAFDRFCAQTGVAMNLVLVGSPGFGHGEIIEAIKLSPFGRFIKQVGYAPSAKIAALMSGASAFCFPSWFEGFGLPNLEAMAAGAPLIISDLPVHREVVGNAALFVQPDDASGWAEALHRIASNENLAHQLVDRGRERVQEYSWARTAAQTWEIFRNLL